MYYSTHFFWGKDGNVVLVDHPCLLLYEVCVGLVFEVFASDPKEDILLAILGSEEFAEGLLTYYKENKKQHSLFGQLGTTPYSYITTSYI